MSGCEAGSSKQTESCLCNNSFDDIREFVDVVCYYNCKICQFSCISAGDIRNHVLESHFQGSADMREGVIASETQPDGGSILCGTSVMQMPGSKMTSPVVATDEGTVSEASGLISEPFSTIYQAGCDFLSSAVTTHSADQFALHPLQNTLVENIAGQALQLLVNSQGVQLNMPCSFRADSQTEINTLPVNVQSSMSSESFESNSVQPIYVPKTSDPPAVQSAVIQTAEGSEQVSEIYVCDSCGTVFNGVGIVEHMLQVHGIHFDSMAIAGPQQPTLHVANEQPVLPVSNKSMDVGMPPNTTSTGTQAQLTKKPGRKRKVIVDLTAEEQNNKRLESNAAKDTAAAIAVKTLGIERLTSAVGENVRTKRRIQPPRALIEDYHILRLRQAKPRTRSAASEEPLLHCSFVDCKAVFRAQLSLDYHIKCHTDSGSFCCPECPSTSDSWSLMLPHLWTNHGVDLYAYHCGRCKFRASDSAAVTEHAIAEHGGSKTVQPFLCSMCGRTFRKASLRNQHEKSHSARRLTPGLTDGSELSESRFVCDVCKRSFANRKSMHKHIEIVHKKIRPFSCSVCGYVTARKAMLQLHERIHTGEKPFKCDLCTYSASDHNTLRRHRMRHTGQKPYRCAFCLYTSIQAISLKTHMRTKHPTAAPSTVPGSGVTSVYSCASCRYQTVNRRSWLGHVEDHRNNPPPAASTDTGSATSDERLFVVERRDGGQLVLAPLLPVAPNMDAGSDAGVDGIQSDSHSTDQLGLRHILRAISEQQQTITAQSIVAPI